MNSNFFLFPCTSTFIILDSICTGSSMKSIGDYSETSIGVNRLSFGLFGIQHGIESREVTQVHVTSYDDALAKEKWIRS
ncbi:hypothetical protein M426DRAFT_211275 [Hypoxylon sp. CI-4A]|nr:hypothetical protein M426DRAFT_211275 [Hypoxylon sp. CI-4A]